MTTMDSDSESQDSDDGRRFRFEATRKDGNARLSSNTTTSGRTSEEKLQYSSRINEDEFRDRKERYKYESGRREYRSSKDRDYEKDSRYSVKYSRESRSSKREDSKDSRDGKISGSSVSKHKSRESRRDRDRDRSDQRKRSRDRSQNGRSSMDKHKNKTYDKYRSRSQEKSRERNKSRVERDRKESQKRDPTRDNNMDRREKDDLDVKDINDDVELATNRDNKMDTSLESHVCKDVNLSEFDVLSETDENLSDSSNDSNDKLCEKKRNSSIEYDSKDESKADQYVEECYKVNLRNSESISGSNNNNPSAVSDPLLGTSSSVISEMTKNYENGDVERSKLNLKEEVALSNANGSPFSIETSSKSTTISHELCTKPDIYGPVLPPQLETNTEDNDEAPGGASFIGPCLPMSESQNLISPSGECENLTSNDSDAVDDPDLAFGPALPPHLIQKKCQNEGDTKIIGPALPNVDKSQDVQNDNKMEVDDDDDGFGPLPADHPALRNNHVYEQLEQRARKIRDQQKDKDCAISQPREEWMTELPPAQASNLGLGPRKFRVRAAPDMSDRSCWTDTPAQRAEKQKQREQEREYRKSPERVPPKESTANEMEKSKKRNKSLLELHQKKLHKKKKKEEKEARLTGHKERRPFDRDIDLKANQFDQAQKKSIILKAQLLDDRFSRGQI